MFSDYGYLRHGWYRTHVHLRPDVRDLAVETTHIDSSITRLNDLSVLQAKVASLPEVRWRNKPSYIVFALGGFSPELQQLAADPAERLYPIADTDVLNR